MQINYKLKFKLKYPDVRGLVVMVNKGFKMGQQSTSASKKLTEDWDTSRKGYIKI